MLPFFRIIGRSDDLQATQRATAKALGVGVATISRDVDNNVPSGTKEEEKYADYEEVISVNVPSGTKEDEIIKKEPTSKELFEKNIKEKEQQPKRWV